MTGPSAGPAVPVPGGVWGPSLSWAGLSFCGVGGGSQQGGSTGPGLRPKALVKPQPNFFWKPPRGTWPWARGPRRRLCHRGELRAPGSGLGTPPQGPPSPKPPSAPCWGLLTSGHRCQVGEVLGPPVAFGGWFPSWSLWGQWWLRLRGAGFSPSCPSQGIGVVLAPGAGLVPGGDLQSWLNPPGTRCLRPGGSDVPDVPSVSLSPVP